MSDGFDWNDPKLIAALKSDGQESFSCYDCKQVKGSLELAICFKPGTTEFRVGPYHDGLCKAINSGQDYAGICEDCRERRGLDEGAIDLFGAPRHRKLSRAVQEQHPGTDYSSLLTNKVSI